MRTKGRTEGDDSDGSLEEAVTDAGERPHQTGLDHGDRLGLELTLF